VKVLAVVEEHDRAEVWEAPRTMLVGVRVQMSPAGETADVRATVPVKPLTGATVIVDVAAVPAVVVTEVGLAETVKSVTMNVTIAVAELAPLVAVTVTVNVVATVAEHDRTVDPLVPVMLVGLKEQFKPAGVTDDVNVTVPPAGLLIVQFDVPIEPAGTVTGVLQLMDKPVPTLIVTVEVWDRVPLVPVTVTVKVPWADGVHERVEV
jgi:hypothetical protein